MAIANLTIEGWPARTQTDTGAQGSNDPRGVAAGLSSHPYSLISPRVSPSKDPGSGPVAGLTWNTTRAGS